MWGGVEIDVLNRIDCGNLSKYLRTLFQGNLEFFSCLFHGSPKYFFFLVFFLIFFVFFVFFAFCVFWEDVEVLFFRFEVENIEKSCDVELNDCATLTCLVLIHLYRLARLRFRFLVLTVIDSSFRGAKLKCLYNWLVRSLEINESFIHRDTTCDFAKTEKYQRPD